MPIKSRRNFKTLIGALDLELTAKAGESLLIKNIMIMEPGVVGVPEYATLTIGKAIVGFFRVASLLGNHLAIPYGRALHSHNITAGSTAVAVMANGALREDAGGTEIALSRLAETPPDEVLVRAMNDAQSASYGGETILQFLGKKGLFEGYPVGEGETFIVHDIIEATSISIVEYEIYDSGDMTPEMPNGSKSDNYVFINYGDTGAVITDEIDTTLGETNNPAEFPDFPFGEVVPSGKKIELLGILASDVSPALNAGAASLQTEFLQLMRGREFLFDEDRQGLLYYSPFPLPLGHQDMIAEGYSIAGNYTQCDRRSPHMFDPPVVFNQGEELVISWHCIIDTAGCDLSQELQEVATILRISPLT